MASIFQDRYLRSRQMVQKAIREYHEKPALRAYMEIFLTLFAISLFAIFAIRPTVKTIGTLIKEIEAKEDTLKTMNEKIANLRIAKELYIKEKEKIQLVKDAIPQKPDPDILALQVTELSEDNFVEIESMSIEGAKIVGPRSDDDNILAFSLSLKGEYLKLLNFVEKLENLRRPVKFESISITTDKQSEEKTIRLDFVGLTTPYFPKL